MSDEGGFRVALGVLSGLVSLVGLPHRLRAHRAGGPVSRWGEGWLILFGLRLAAASCFAGVAAFLYDPATMAWSRVSLPAWLRWAGLLPGALALGLLIWMFRSLGLNLTDTVATRPGATLVTTGPYRWVRHPMYVGVALMLAAVSLLTASAWVATTGLVVMAFLAARTPIEEANLVARFGDEYRAYRARTGAVLPRVGRARPTQPS